MGKLWFTIAQLYDFICYENSNGFYRSYTHSSEPTHQKDPIDEFPTVENDHTHYLRIDNNGLSPGIDLRQKHVDFWNKIKSKALELSNDARQNEVDAEID